MSVGPATPSIVITVAVAEAPGEPEITTRENELYTAAIERAGGGPVLLEVSSTLPADPRPDADSGSWSGR